MRSPGRVRLNPRSTAACSSHAPRPNAQRYAREFTPHPILGRRSFVRSPSAAPSRHRYLSGVNSSVCTLSENLFPCLDCNVSMLPFAAMMRSEPTAVGV